MASKVARALSGHARFRWFADTSIALPSTACDLGYGLYNANRKARAIVVTEIKFLRGADAGRLGRVATADHDPGEGRHDQASDFIQNEARESVRLG